MSEWVVLVNQNDKEYGVMEKMEAHLKGALHRAFSVFLFNEKGEMLLQQRAKSKYHSGGLWTNACCSHPRPGENVIIAAKRRLEEEMGMKVDDLEEMFSFLYRSELDKGLIEHELDHVVFAMSDAVPNINPEEVEAYRYVMISDLFNEIEASPESFTEWFKIGLPRLVDQMHSSITLTSEFDRSLFTPNR